MHSDRKYERKTLSYPGWIRFDENQPSPCLIEDASDGGARLSVRDSDALPERFRLFLSPTAQSSRICVVKWRKPGSVGVQFANVSAGISERL